MLAAVYLRPSGERLPLPVLPGAQLGSFPAPLSMPPTQLPQSRLVTGWGWLGGLYHFVGRPGSRVRGRTGRELQALPLLFHRAALMSPHAVNLLLHAHLDLALAREHSTLGALLLQQKMRALMGVHPPLPASSSALMPSMSFLWEACL